MNNSSITRAPAKNASPIFAIYDIYDCSVRNSFVQVVEDFDFLWVSFSHLVNPLNKHLVLMIFWQLAAQTNNSVENIDQI